jgi:methyl-accepting chemotaxis protein
MKALTEQGIPLITFQTPPALVFYRVHTPKLFGDDISARRNTVVEAMKTGKPIVGVEPGREALGIFGMTPILRDGNVRANVDVGASFGKEFVDRAKKRFAHRSRRAFVRRQGIQKAILDLRRYRRARGTEARVRRRAASLPRRRHRGHVGMEIHAGYLD